ncbi:hypothetical protein BDV10DRAFT_166183 [Aspergillus recurvatus]
MCKASLCGLFVDARHLGCAGSVLYKNDILFPQIEALSIPWPYNHRRRRFPASGNDHVLWPQFPGRCSGHNLCYETNGQR